MDFKNVSIPVPCPRHPSEFIQRIDLDPFSIQQAYCFDCILNYDNPTKLSSQLKSIKDFIDFSSTFYLESKDKTTFGGEVPPEYDDLLCKQGERLEELEKHIEEEKKKVEAIFAVVTQDILTLLTEKKTQYLGELDQQVSKLHQWYTFIEKRLRKTYPSAQDIPILFPTKEDLMAKINKITNMTQLTAFIKNIKEDLNDPNFGKNAQKYPSNEAGRISSLQTLVRKLSYVEKMKPGFDPQKWDIAGIKNKLAFDIKKTLDESFLLENQVPEPGGDPSTSQIAKSEDFEVIRGWLPGNFKFLPRLLYRGREDGMNPSAFHRKCDGKGPTLTLVKGQFQGSDKVSLLGGYLDKSWHKENCYIESKIAFIFSVTKKIKCGVVGEKYAAYGGEANGPTFGGGADLGIMVDGENFVHQTSYSETKMLVEKEKFFGGYAHFMVMEVEVFALE